MARAALTAGLLLLAGCVAHHPAVDPHVAALTLDAHVDIELPDAPSRYADPDGTSKVAPAKMRAGGLDAVVLSVAVSAGPRTEAGYAEADALAAAKLAAVDLLAAEPDTVLARTAEDLVAAHDRGDLAIVLGLQNARLLSAGVDAIDAYYDRGVRVFGLTHMGHNNYADSSRPLFVAALGHHEPDAEHGGLSDLGRAAVQRVNALGGINDVSQLSRDATLQVVSLSSAPVIASHSNVQALTNVRRNLSDAEIDAIAAGGGVIHLAPFRGYLFDSNNDDLDAEIRAVRREAGILEDYDYPFELYWEIDDPEVQGRFVGAVSALLGEGSIGAMLDHLDYIVARVGVDHVGIGTDFNHGSGVRGFSNAAQARNVTNALLARGYSVEDVAKIWGGNFLRAWRAAEAGARR